MTLQHNHVKKHTCEVQRVFVGNDYNERIYLTYTYKGQFIRATRWTGLNVNTIAIKPADLRHYNVNETYYRIVTKKTTISWIYGKKDLFQTLLELGYNIEPLKTLTK
jgi:hypothetical protein